MHIIGSAGEVRERAAQWEETGVTTLLLSCRTPDEVRQIAEVARHELATGDAVDCAPAPTTAT